MTTYHDEIWLDVPDQRRPLERAVVEFALVTVGAADPLRPVATAGAADPPRPAGADRAGTRGVAAPRVLDLGCGDGRLAAELAAAGARVTGVDPSEVALERARARDPELELTRPAPDGRLPFEDASFDVVFCVDVLQHVADTQLLLSEVRRVLDSGGRLAVVVPYHGRVKNALIALGRFERHYDPLEPVLRFYTPRSLRRLLEAFAFEQVELRAAAGLPLLRESLMARARRPGIGAA